MYRIPADLDLSPVVGEFTTQVRVGQFDIQFTFGRVNFAIQSDIKVIRDGEIHASWEEGKWPEPGFYDIMNRDATSCEIVTDRLIVITLKDGIEIHLNDDSDQYEAMQISFDGEDKLWVI